MAVKIVTDTGCDLPPDLVERYGIILVPLVLIFGDAEALDSAETRAELWQRIDAGLPCATSGPAAGAYQAVFDPLIAAGHEVVCITLTGAHSVTYTSACLAAASHSEHITVVDGRSLSLGYGFLALEAAELAAAGASRAEIVAEVEAARQRLTLRFFLESLELVRRGGRLDGMMPLLNRLTSALNLRALLTCNDEGRISFVATARGRRGAAKRIAQEVADARPAERVMVVHSRSLPEAEALADELAAALDFPRGDVMLAEIGAVLIAHGGAGVLGAGAIKAR